MSKGVQEGKIPACIQAYILRGEEYRGTKGINENIGYNNFYVNGYEKDWQESPHVGTYQTTNDEPISIQLGDLRNQKYKEVGKKYLLITYSSDKRDEFGRTGVSVINLALPKKDAEGIYESLRRDPGSLLQLLQNIDPELTKLNPPLGNYTRDQKVVFRKEIVRNDGALGGFDIEKINLGFKEKTK